MATALTSIKSGVQTFFSSFAENKKYSFVTGLFCGAAAAAALTYKILRNNASSVEGQPKEEVGEALAERLKPYFDLLDRHPKILGPEGNADKGEIEIVRDLNRIAQIQKETGQKVGILAENRWQIWLCDAVKFPNGSYGVYGRFLWKQTIKGSSGAAVLPIMPDGKILLICIYRHALRKWALEIPRGVGEGAETINALIKRELQEETGAEFEESTLLGHVHPDSGLTSGNIPIVRVKIAKIGNHNRDPAESSICLHSFTMEELQDAIREGYAKIKINGQMQSVEIADGFLLSALVLNQLKAVNLLQEK